MSLLAQVACSARTAGAATSLWRKQSAAAQQQALALRMADNVGLLKNAS